MSYQRVVMNREKDMFNENLNEETPLLNSIPKRNPFVVPEGYFDALPALIMDKCRESEKGATQPVADKIFWLFRPQWMITAFIFVAGFSLFLREGNKDTLSYETIAANIPDSVIMENLQNNIDYVDVNSLEEATQNSGNMPSLQPAQDTTNNKQIINYLINNNVDASDIENEL